MNDIPVFIQIGTRKMAWELVPDLVSQILLNPDPRKWFRFEPGTNDDTLMHVRIEEQGEPKRCASCGYISTALRHRFCPVDGFILNTYSEGNHGSAGYSETGPGQRPQEEVEGAGNHSLENG